MNFEELPEFTKEFKRLVKKYPTLSQDFAVFKKVLPAQFNLEDNNKNFEILKEVGAVKVVKARLKVKCLKGVPMTRVIFILRVKNDTVDFIEIYLKNQSGKDREDRMRIDFYLNR